jgi:hypothetical protein
MGRECRENASPIDSSGAKSRQFVFGASKQKQILRSLDAGLSSMEMAEIRHFPRFARADLFKDTGPAGTKSRADSMS